MENKRQWVVAPEEAGMALLAFLRKKYREAPSVKAIKRAIDGKFCTVNGRVETFSSHPLKTGVKVELDLAAFAERKRAPSLFVLYEDEELLICNKPAGMVSDNRYFNQQLPDYRNRLELVHRLDKETSGAIVLAKNSQMKERMFDLFAKRKVHKVYLALVDGEMGKDEDKIDNFLGSKTHFAGQTVYQVVAAEKGQRAITYWTCVKRGEKVSLLLCEPLTGRTHQLRVHLSAIGHPILGDVQYGKHFRCKLRPQRHLLHAYSIFFTHPLNEKEIEAIAPIPLDFKEALELLKAYPDGASGLAFSRAKTESLPKQTRRPRRG